MSGLWTDEEGGTAGKYGLCESISKVVIYVDSASLRSSQHWIAKCNELTSKAGGSIYGSTMNLTKCGSWF